MFWDDVHPSANMHALLADAFYKKYNVEYHFTQPMVKPLKHQEHNVSRFDLVRQFESVYKEKLAEDRNGLFGFFRHSKIDLKKATLDSILDHAFYKGGKRSLDIIVGLGWFDKKGNLRLDIPALVRAKERVDAAHNDEAAPLLSSSKVGGGPVSL